MAQPVVLHLRNGDRLTGHLLAEEPGRITISNAILGRLVVPLAEIERRQQADNKAAFTNVLASTQPAALTPVAQKRLKDLQAVYLAGQVSAEEFHRQRLQILADTASFLSVTNQPGNQVPKPAGAAGVAAKTVPTPAKPAGPKQWSGEVFLGTDLGFGEKSRELYTGRLKLNYVRTPLRNNMDYLFTYGRTDGELSANRMDGLMKTDYDLNRKIYLYFLGGAGYDEIRKIDWRYEVGPGAGYHLLKLTNFVLRLEGGFHFQVQNLEGNQQNDIFYHRLAQDMKWNIGTQFTFDEKVEYLPEWNDFHVYKLRVEANLRYWLRSNLSLNFTVINFYDTVTAKGVGQNDLQLRSSIGLKF